jgi:ubiquinone/menaquinone biosynthesis C-methylase UbiE
MTFLVALVTTALVLALIVILGWRLLARKLTLPCPAALIWLLENRLMERVAGSKILIERAKIERGMRVLDAGCGPGRVTLPVAEHVGPQGEVVALDVQAGMLERLAERIQAKGLGNIRPMQAALGEGILGRGQFDRALMVTVLGEVPDRSAALGEIYQALRPGGILSVTEVLPDPHYQARRTVHALGQSVGFKVDEVYSGIRSYTMNLVRPGGQQPSAAPETRQDLRPRSNAGKLRSGCRQRAGRRAARRPTWRESE